MQKWGLLLVGGVVGTAGRYALTAAVHRWAGAGFPYGTLAVNLLGCLAAGFLGAWLEHKSLLTPEARMFWFTGLLGAFTTFSALIYESWRLIQDGNVAMAGVNLLGSVTLGLAVFWLGTRAAALL
jgi:fluoride exporter